MNRIGTALVGKRSVNTGHCHVTTVNVPHKRTRMVIFGSAAQKED